MCKQLINTQFESAPLAYSLSPSCLRLVKTCYIFGVSVGCLEGVWEVSGICLSDFRYCCGGMVLIHLIKIQFGSFESAASFSPSGHFKQLVCTKAKN